MAAQLLGKPLEKLKVLDFSTLLPGPYATMLMADMGAEILRIEAIGRHDLVQSFQPQYNGHSYAYLTLNRNKKVMGLDLKKAEAVEIVKKLIVEYDIVIEQLRPGVMAKLGLDYDTLKIINPKLIYCSITGYGQSGCYKDRAGHDINYLALSGLASFSGTKTTGPVLSGTQIADIAGGSHHAVIGILSAVIQRGISGKGQHIDISMTDAAFALTGMFGAGAVGADIDPELGQTMLNGGCFYGYYQTQDNRYLSVGSLEPKFSALFFENIGHGEWLKRANTVDVNKQQALINDISEVIAQKTLDEWMILFDLLDACVEPVLTVSEAAKSPLMVDRNMVIDVMSVNGEKVKQIAPAIKFIDPIQTATGDDMYLSELNQALTNDILSNIQYKSEQIDNLRDTNVIN